MGCDKGVKHKCLLLCNFNPRTPGGVRLSVFVPPVHRQRFQSTHPGWGATPRIRANTSVYHQFQSTHPGWGATSRLIVIDIHHNIFQSTHPGWGATQHDRLSWIHLPISIHAPRVGCDRLHRLYNMRGLLFQSTHPGWGATRSTVKAPRCKLISIHAPRVGCDSLPLLLSLEWLISIHAPRVGCDSKSA